MNNNSYNPAEHLVEWLATSKKTGQTSRVIHYPLGWRIYELSQRYPDANFDSEPLHIDAEHDFVVVRVRLFIGMDYETSTKKTTATKQGKLSEYDKVEGNAMSRCCRNWGLGTEHALSMVPKKPKLADDIRDRANALYDQAKALNLMEKPSNSAFVRLMADILGREVVLEELTLGDLDVVGTYLDSQQ